MNKFALTTVAALPGSGGGASAWQSPEVVRKEARPATCSRNVHDAVYVDPHVLVVWKDWPPVDDVVSHAEDALVWGPAATGSYKVVVPDAKRAEWKRNNYMALYGNKSAAWNAMGYNSRAARIEQMTTRLADPLSFADYEAAWKEIASDPELEEYFSSRN